MAFTQKPPTVPTSIGNVQVILSSKNEANEVDEFGNIINTTRKQSISYRIQVIDQDGNQMIVLTGNLQPHLTTPQLTQLSDFLDTMVQKAIDEIL